MMGIDGNAPVSGGDAYKAIVGYQLAHDIFNLFDCSPIQGYRIELCQ